MKPCKTCIHEYMAKGCDDCAHVFEAEKPEHVKGEIIELPLNYKKSGDIDTEQWVFTGKKRKPNKGEYFYNVNTIISVGSNYVWGNPEWIVEPAPAEFKVRDIVLTCYPDDSPNGLREISSVDENGVSFTNGKIAIFRDIKRPATNAETLTFWEDKCTVTRNGVRLRAYENENKESIKVFVQGGHPILYNKNNLFFKVLNLPDVIPYSVSKGVYKSPEKEKK